MTNMYSLREMCRFGELNTRPWARETHLQVNHRPITLIVLFSPSPKIIEGDINLWFELFGSIYQNGIWSCTKADLGCLIRHLVHWTTGKPLNICPAYVGTLSKVLIMLLLMTISIYHCKSNTQTLRRKVRTFDVKTPMPIFSYKS